LTGWLVPLITITIAYGPARALASRSAVPAQWALTATLSVLVGFGGLSLAMFWLGLAGLPFGGALPYIVLIALAAPGWALAARSGELRAAPPYLPRIWWLPLALLTAIAGAALLNAALWPFYRADALGIYVQNAVELYQTGALVPINADRYVYELYPQLMSFSFAAVYDASGWANPYPAHVVNTLLGLAALPTTFALARAVFPAQREAAFVATLLLALTPDFGRWVHAGYVDLPMAACYATAAAFAVAGAREGRRIDWMVAGLCVGLAAWTKNAGLLGVGLFFIYAAFHLMYKQRRLNDLLLTCTVVVIVAAPWYARNLVLANLLIPDTVWADDARQTVHEVFVLVSRPQNYGLPGWVMLIGIGWAVARKRARVLLYWSVPYFAMWFFFASYDPRFILLMLPFWAVAGAGMLVEAAEHTGRWKKPLRVVALVLAAVLALGVMMNTVEYKRALLANPVMSHAQKMEVVR